MSHETTSTGHDRPRIVVELGEELHDAGDTQRHVRELAPRVADWLATYTGLHVPATRIVLTTALYLPARLVQAELDAAGITLTGRALWAYRMRALVWLHTVDAATTIDRAGVLVLLRYRAATSDRLATVLAHQLVHATQLADPHRRQAKLAAIRHDAGVDVLSRRRTRALNTAAAADEQLAHRIEHQAAATLGEA